MPEFHSTRTPDLTGRRFEKWTVVSFANRDDGVRWLCRCECGRERIIRGADLTGGRSRSCKSCAKSGRPRKDYSGQTFGKWTVLSFSHGGKHGSRWWLCRCECGHEQVIPLSWLASKEIGGCRTCKAKRQRRRAHKRVWNVIQSNARERGLDFQITQEYALSLLEDQGFRCALSGLPICIAESSKGHLEGETTASLDRIDSSVGYLVGNVQWLHKHVNKMKWDLPQDRFIEVCRMIVDKHNET